jgi:hypothetical protein
MKTETAVKKVNVAPSSESGHYIEGAKQVINLDEVNETFVVKGESKLTTKNHTTLIIPDDCIITTQVVYDPFKETFIKSKD